MHEQNARADVAKTVGFERSGLKNCSLHVQHTRATYNPNTIFDVIIYFHILTQITVLTQEYIFRYHDRPSKNAIM